MTMQVVELPSSRIYRQSHPSRSLYIFLPLCDLIPLACIFRVGIYRATNLIHSITVECNYNGGRVVNPKVNLRS